ncbi:MAG: ankyrin repeat domain-containing protein, partial [Candidatus Methylacidiphilales bacterium]|nr:ankyrin repeat domain-containing protein [Candidatus Methylacidiphilales bacterium]
MKLTPVASPLPDRPSLDFLKDQAKRLLKQLHAEDPAAVQLLRTHHPAFKGVQPLPAQAGSVALHDAQLVIARQHGCASWSKLKDEIEARKRLQITAGERLLRAVWAGRLEDLQTELAAAAANPSDFAAMLRRNAGMAKSLREALAGIADRSVWHRPQYREMARHLIGSGVECSAWTAARFGLKEYVQQYMEADPSLMQALDPQGRTVLQRAALIYGSDADCESTVEWLIQRGARIDIFTASAFSMAEVVREELRRDPTLVHRKCQGSTPLNWAVRPRSAFRVTEDGKRQPADTPQHSSKPRDTAVCEILLDNGAETDSQDDQENGMHPLHHAAEWCSSEETALLLLARGANLQAMDDRGWTPLDYALSRNRKGFVAFLKRHGARQTLVDWPNTWGGRRDLLIASVKRNDIASVERLLEEDAASESSGLASAREESGDTALHWAAHDGHFEIAELLLKHGADVSAQETRHWGGTPLHWASERQAVLVDLLLRHGAAINSRNERTGQTPLHYCARCDDVPEVAELLLSRGADPSLTDNRGNRPVDYAIKG